MQQWAKKGEETPPYLPAKHWEPMFDSAVLEIVPSLDTLPPSEGDMVPHCYLDEPFIFSVSQHP